MRRACSIAACIMIVAAAAAFAAPRHLIVPPAGTGVGEIALGPGTRVVEQYPNAVWVEGQADAARAQGAFVKTWDDWDVIRTVRPFSIGQREGVTVAQQPGLYLVHFRAPLRAEWAAAVRALPGVTVVQSFPNLALVIHVTRSGVRFDALPGVDWAGELIPEWRVSPHVDRVPAETTGDAVLMLVDAPGLDGTLQRMRDLGVSFLAPDMRTSPWFQLRASGTRAMVDEVSSLEHVLWIEPYYPMELHDEIQGMAVSGQHSGWQPDAPGYKAWLASVGLDDLSTVIIDVADDGWDTGDFTVGNHHPDFDDATGTTCRVLYAHDLCGDGNHGVGGHGTINMAIAFGDGAGTAMVDPDGYSYGTGIAPTARGGNTKVFSDAGSFCPLTMVSATAPAQAAGAHITSNSWGAATYGGYNANAAEYDLLVRDANADPSDGLQEFTVVFSAGNNGPSTGQTGAPGVAKNVITSGASENVRDHGQLDGCGDANADSFQDITDFSSPGPTEDGRIKPDAMAPGNHVQGAASQYSGFDGSSVCGGPNNDFGPPPDDAYWPAGQTWYSWSSGTSHSTPGMAGQAALIYEWYLDEHGVPPSPAMIKAIMLATADDMVGGDDGNGGTIQSLPNVRQGWGLVNMGRVTDGSGYFTFDQEHTFTSSGQDISPAVQFTVTDPTKPVRIMMTYADAPGDPNATPSGGLGNDLDLEVTAGGDTYLGNVFSGGFSTTGGTADATNNVEAVYLPAGAVSSFTLRVIASSIAADAIPGDGNPTDQDFALYIHNATDQSSNGVVSLGDDTYSCSSTVQIVVSDQDLQGAGTQDVAILSTTEPTPETVSLTEAPAGSGVFAGSIDTTGDPASGGDGLVSVAHGDTITVEYTDADTGGGSGAVKTATASVDCAGPGISDVSVGSISEASAVVEWLTDEQATATVEYGMTTPPSLVASTPGLQLGHAVTLTGLSSCAKYFYQVTSCDALGNCTTDDNGGAYYSFTSGQRLVTFAEDVESGINGWTAEAPWGITDSHSVSPTHAWTDSPGGNYANNVNVALTSPVIDLSAGVGTELRFQHRFDLETDTDYGYVEATTDGASWSLLATSSGLQTSWTEEVVDLSAFDGSATFKLRFRLDTNGSTTRDGWYVDDIEISSMRSCSAGFMTLDQALYTCGATVEATVVDLDLNTDPGAQETVDVTLSSTTEPGGETVTLTESGPDSTYFVGTILTTTDAPAADGQLSVSHGDAVTATYQDADDGTGTPATVIDSAVMDCEGPTITDVQVVDIGPGRARIVWTTDEPADSVVTYTGGAVSDDALVYDHSIQLTGLTPCWTYSYQVSSTDIVGHTTLSPPGQFDTPGGMLVIADSTDTPAGIPDGNPAGMDSTIDITEDRAISDVNVMVNITHTWDDDLDIYLFGPDGAFVELSTDNGGDGDGYVGTVFDDEAAVSIVDGTAPFTGSYRPEGSLATLDGISALGTWRLHIGDDVTGDVGTLDSWQLQLELNAPCEPPLFADGFESGDTDAWSDVVP